MTQLLCHLVGDYCLQSHVMATRKTSSWKWACIHAFFYTLPFAVVLTQSPWKLLVIGGTHAVIDRHRIALRWCKFYGVGHPGLWLKKGSYARATFEAPPAYLSTWLVIIVDNTFHLIINAWALS